MPVRKVFKRLIPSQRIYLGYIRITAALGRVDNCCGFDGRVLMVVTVLHYFIPLH